MFQGETKQLIVTVYDENEQLLQPFTPTAVEWRLYQASPSRSKQAVIVKKLGDGISIDSTNSKVLIALFSADTADLAVGQYYHELKLFSGSDENVVMIGDVTLRFATKTEEV
jgi:hypothetical protein